MKKHRVIPWVCAVIGLWGGADLHAAVYHVARLDLAASDENNGSLSRPLKTISSAVGRLQPGDRVVVHEGVYREQVSFDIAGEDWNESVEIAAAPGEQVTIKGSDVVHGWTKHAGAVWKKAWPYNSQIVFADGERLQQIAGEMVSYWTDSNRWRGRVGDGLEDMMPGSFYYDLEGQTLYVWLRGGGDPNLVNMEATVRRHLVQAGGQYYRIRGFRMMHSNTSAEINWAAVTLSGSHVRFENNQISWCDSIGLSFYGSHFSIVSNTINYCGNSGIGGRSIEANELIDNETNHNNWRKWNPFWHAGGIKLIPTVRHLTIRRHKALHNQGSGIWIDALDTADVTIERCVTAHNLQHGIHYEAAREGTIINNLAHHNAGRGIYLSNASDCLVAHNVVHANGMSGIVSVGVDRAAPVEKVGPKGVVPARNNVLIGNILYDNEHPALKPAGWYTRPELILPDPRQDPELFGGCSSDYNIYFRTEGRAFYYWYNFGSGHWVSLDSWQEATGNDRHSLEADPLFVDPQQGDYRVRSGSPAIDLVPWLEEVKDDHTGAARATGPDRRRTAGIHEHRP